MARVSLAVYFEEVARRSSDVAFVHKRGYRRERWTYRRVCATAACFAAELRERGIATGDRVMLWGANSAEWAVAFWGCLLRGAVAVPIDDAAAPDFARRVAREAGVKLLVASREKVCREQSLIDATLPVMALEDLPKMARGRHMPTRSTTIGAHGQRSAVFSDEPLGRGHIAQIVFTSGTTAEPRGVVITHGNILANLEPLERGIQPYLKYERCFHPLRFVNLLPLSHLFGQFLGIFVPPLLGATVVFEDTLKPSEILQTIRRERATLLVAVPRVLDSLRGKIERDIEARREGQEFDAKVHAADGKKFLRRAWIFRRVHRQFGWKFWAIVSGGATLAAATETFFSRMGYAVIQGYGLTETTSLISVNHPFAVGQGSIGKILPGREIKLGDNGEIMVRGDSVAAGYWEGGSLKPASEAGWFSTGDSGAFDESGNLYFKGRQKNVIVTPAGMNVYPEDLEAALRRDPAVQDCVVVALEQGGNAEPCAVLILKHSDATPVSADAQQQAVQIIERAGQSLAEYQRLRQWLVWPEMDFPRTSTGKPRTQVIAEAAKKALSTKQGSAESSGGTRLAKVSASQATMASAATQNQGTIFANLVATVLSRSRNSATGGEVPSEANLETNLNLSSLDRVELMSAIEDRFQVSLNEIKFAEARTVADLERLLKCPEQQRSEFHYPRWTQRFPVPAIRAAIYYLLVWPATHLLAHPRVRGREHLRAVRGPVLIVSNHVTRRTDIGFILAALPLRLRHRLAAAMGGETLGTMRHPPRQWFFLKRLVYRLNYFLVVALFNVFPLPQRSGFRESFQFAGESVDRGYSVLVFPEGELTSDGTLGRFENGVGLLANNLNIPVVLMRIDGLWEVKQTGWRFARPGKIKVTIGSPVTYPPATPAGQIVRDLESRVRSL
ncbi:MAG TPA: AMP-binding protein [Candidatus Dormibacteraeota bacterium]|nr:AMP-binding protein [Candidatus Dormibacteraeota bacterium]